MDAEFQKGATVRPYGRATFFRDCARFGFLNAKMDNLTLLYLFGVIFQTFLLVFGPFGLRKTFEQKYWLRKNNCF